MKCNTRGKIFKITVVHNIKETICSALHTAQVLLSNFDGFPIQNEKVTIEILRERERKTSKHNVCH